MKTPYERQMIGSLLGENLVDIYITTCIRVESKNSIRCNFVEMKRSASQKMNARIPWFENLASNDIEPFHIPKIEDNYSDISQYSAEARVVDVNDEESAIDIEEGEEESDLFSEDAICLTKVRRMKFRPMQSSLGPRLSQLLTSNNNLGTSQTSASVSTSASVPSSTPKSTSVLLSGSKHLSFPLIESETSSISTSKLSLYHTGHHPYPHTNTHDKCKVLDVVQVEKNMHAQQDEFWKELTKLHERKPRSSIAVTLGDHSTTSLPRPLIHPSQKHKTKVLNFSTSGACVQVVPHLKVKVQGVNLTLTNFLGVGAFGHVLLGHFESSHHNRDNSNNDNAACALKVDSGITHSLWETVLHTRIAMRLRNSEDEDNGEGQCGSNIDILRNSHERHFLYPTSALLFSNASLLLMPCAELGSLLRLISVLHSSKSASSFSPREREYCAAYFVHQMLRSIDVLHFSHILHTDIKTDNWVLRVRGGRGVKGKGTQLGEIDLCLIDFGKSKDVSGGEIFVGSTAAKHMASPQMLTGQAWCYHADYYAIAACMHTLLFGSDLNTNVEAASMARRCGYPVETNTDHSLHVYIPRVSIPRYLSQSLWKCVYFTLLNSNSSPTMRLNLEPLLDMLQDRMNEMEKEKISLLSRLIGTLSS
jgi:serine/threonine protein kinase